MECLKCKSKWETSVSTMKNCPFCGADLYEEADDEIEVFDTSAEVLAYICRRFGADVLLGKRLSGYVADCAPELPESDKWIIRNFYELGASELLEKAINGSEDDKLEAVKKAIARLTDKYIAPQIAERITYEFSNALGWNVGKSAVKTESQEKNVPKNNADELFKLGLRYEKGEGVELDYKKAEEYYLLAAEQGHVEAYYRLGYHYDLYCVNGEEAVKWYKLAAEKGHAAAQDNLGDCYYYGRGVTQSYEEAVKWYEFAAWHGYKDAQLALGFLYAAGIGVAQSYEEAAKWYGLAAKEHDCKEAQKCYEILDQKIIEDGVLFW